MKAVLAALVLTALAVGANPARADLAEAAALRAGDMEKLVFHDVPQPASGVPFQLEDDGGEATLADWRGRWVLVNFWATWCAPCKHEMPMLSDLQSEFGGDRFEVLTIATSRNSAAGIKRFFEDVGVDNLPRHTDPGRSPLAADMGVFGLPITLILDPAGNEIARLRGDADWSSDSAKAIIAALMAGG